MLILTQFNVSSVFLDVFINLTKIAGIAKTDFV